MTVLRQQLIRELVLHGMAERTQEAYVHQVYHLSKFYRLSPDQLSEGQVREYLFYLTDQRKLAASTVNQAVNAFRFFYGRVLHRDLEVLRQTLPHRRKASAVRKCSAPVKWRNSSRWARCIPCTGPF